MAEPGAIERHSAWQCIGCGRIDAPRPCVGVCQDRKVELVAARELQPLLDRIATLEAVLRLAAQTTPRPDGWERSYRKFQAQARRLLGE